jgi:hypothetical protein
VVENEAPHKRLEFERDIFVPKNMDAIFIDEFSRSLLKKIISTANNLLKCEDSTTTCQ